jgi:hypothetical protein
VWYHAHSSTAQKYEVQPQCSANGKKLVKYGVGQ